jgi:serine/threonine protein kinase
VSEEIGEYVLLEQVGTGRQSTVHRARSRDRAGRIVAVKRLHVDADDDVVRRLQREAEVLASLSHPAIMPLLDVVPDPQGGVALVFPYAPGGTLERQLASRGSLPWHEVADLGARLASALAAAHGAGVLHRDVKPANVLLGVEDEPRLADFGTVVLHDRGHLLDDGVVIGTAEYLDPAVAVSGADPGPRSDLYSLAVMLFRALSGQLPYAGGTPAATIAAADRGVHAPLGQLTDAPAEMVAAIERSMARDPNQRFGAVQQLGVVLEGLARAADRDRMSDLAGRMDDIAVPDRPAASDAVVVPPAPPAETAVKPAAAAGRGRGHRNASVRSATVQHAGRTPGAHSACLGRPRAPCPAAGSPCRGGRAVVDQPWCRGPIRPSRDPRSRPPVRWCAAARR